MFLENILGGLKETKIDPHGLARWSNLPVVFRMGVDIMIFAVKQHDIAVILQKQA